MANEIIPYLEMCRREASSLQRGMNFNLGKGYSVILMSVRPNAPYRDSFGDDGSTIIYEGHDVPRSHPASRPKSINQSSQTPSGRLTENGKFYQAAEAFKRGEAQAHAVRVYEKIHPGIWSYNGVFHLVDAWQERVGKRLVFKFKLIAVDSSEDVWTQPELDERRRLIPTLVKIEVWDRDRGKCVICGATTELHFDHVLPYSKGGTSLTAKNVQLLCARHNLSKGAKIV
jgi:HNH endonuclease